MARQTATLAFLVCALAVGGQVRAASYDDAVAGNWDSSTTWNVTDGHFPGSPTGGADVVTIDGVQVTANIAITTTVADVALIDITGSGTFYINDKTISQSAALQLDGGTLRINVDDVVTNSDITVKSASELKIHSCWNYGGCYLDGEISDHTPGSVTGLITKTEAGTVHLRHSNPNFSGGWDITAGAVYITKDGAFGTGTITMAAGTAIRVGATQTINPASITSAGRIDFNKNAVWDLTLEDGATIDVSSAKDVGAGATAFIDNGTVHIRCTQNNETNNYKADISGTGKLILQATSGGGCGLGLYGDNRGFAGDIDIDTHSGTAALVMGNANALSSNTGGTVTLKSRGAYYAEKDSILSFSASFDRNLTFEHGTQLKSASSKSIAYSGTATLEAGTAIFQCPRGNNQSGTLTLDGRITGDGEAYFLLGGTTEIANNRIYVKNAANDYAGGTRVDCSTAYRRDGYYHYVRVTADGALPRS